MFVPAYYDLADLDDLRRVADEHGLYTHVRKLSGEEVVTSFEFQRHPVDTVIRGPFFWPIENLETTVRWHREWLPESPRDVSAFYLIHEEPGKPFPEAVHGEKTPRGSPDAARGRAID